MIDDHSRAAPALGAASRVRSGRAEPSPHCPLTAVAAQQPFGLCPEATPSWVPRIPDKSTAWRTVLPTAPCITSPGSITSDPTEVPTGHRSPAASSERAVVLRAAVQRAPRTMRNDTPMASTAVHELGPMLTASEVAEMLHLHVNTVKRLGDRGELPFYRVCKRGDRRFRLDDVMAFLARNR